MWKSNDSCWRNKCFLGFPREVILICELCGRFKNSHGFRDYRYNVWFILIVRIIISIGAMYPVLNYKNHKTKQNKTHAGAESVECLGVWVRCCWDNGARRSSHGLLETSTDIRQGCVYSGKIKPRRISPRRRLENMDSFRWQLLRVQERQARSRVSSFRGHSRMAAPRNAALRLLHARKSR